ncbi:MAG: hypothetical protein NTY22_01790 [Proteobacteria bacterium]|nr:hypothetical protein [Pseudomonadota bacterium]
MFDESLNKYSSVDPAKSGTFAKTLDEKRKSIFENIILSDKRKRSELAKELGLAPTTFDRWEKKIREAYDKYLETGELSNKYALVEPALSNDFAAGLDPTREAIFRGMILSKDKSGAQLSKELGMAETTLYRWEDEIRRDFDEYLNLHTGDAGQDIPFDLSVEASEFSDIDPVVLNDFAYYSLKTPKEKYILVFRIASKTPETLEQIADKFKTTASEIIKIEKNVLKKLGRYLLYQNVPEDIYDDRNISFIRNAAKLYKEQDNISKIDIINKFFQDIKITCKSKYASIISTQEFRKIMYEIDAADKEPYIDQKIKKITSAKKDLKGYLKSKGIKLNLEKNIDSIFDPMILMILGN